MKVRINNDKEFFMDKDTPINPIQIKEPVLIVADPSKQNMAVLVGNLYGKIYEIYELSGKDPSGYAQDTIDYCIEMRSFLTQRFAECQIVEMSQEEAIDKKGRTKEQGLLYFKTSMILRDVRAFYIVAAVDLTGSKPHMFNNQVWKTSVLPPGYNKHGIKGSKVYLNELTNNEYINYSDDITDVICQYYYRVKALSTNAKICCTEKEDNHIPYKYFITDIKNVKKDIMKEFVYNSGFSLIDNMNYFTNRIVKGVGYSKIDISTVSPLEMAKHCLTSTYQFEPVVIVATSS